MTLKKRVRMKVMLIMTILILMMMMMMMMMSMMMTTVSMMLTTTLLTVWQEPMTARSGEVVTVRVSFTNPGSLPLTNCTFNMDGNLTVAQDDTNNFIGGSGDWRDYGSWSKVVGSVALAEVSSSVRPLIPLIPRMIRLSH